MTLKPFNNNAIYRDISNNTKAHNFINHDNNGDMHTHFNDNTNGGNANISINKHAINNNCNIKTYILLKINLI